MSKCKVCRGPAIIDLPRHNANFCGEHLQQLCRRQVEKAIKDFRMLAPGERVLVAVSGGKDSLAVWDLLVELGYEADGLYVGLGIGEYSDESGEYAQRFADERGLTLHTIDLRDEYGYDVPTAAKATRRVPCSACGTSKRHLFDRAARDGGYAVVATGHNLDDEAAVLFGNTLRWDVDYLARQLPVLPGDDHFPRKVKPLVRLTEREMAAWCIVRGIDYQVEECPMAAGNRHLGYKETLNAVEARSPGSKASFYLNFLDNMAPILAGTRQSVVESLGLCERCGAPTTAGGESISGGSTGGGGPRVSGSGGSTGGGGPRVSGSGGSTGGGGPRVSGSGGSTGGGGPRVSGSGGSTGGGAPRVCAFCRIVEKSSAHEPVPVELVASGKGRRRR